MADTLATGCGLCDEAVVRQVVTAAPDCIRELIEWGATSTEGRRPHQRRAARAATPRARESSTPAATRPARKSPPRCSRHAGREPTSIDVREETFAIDLLTAGDRGRRSPGVARHARASTHPAGGRSLPPAASGASTARPPTPTSPPATAWPWPTGRGGHWRTWKSSSSIPPRSTSPGPRRHLISETVRGEGGRLVDKAGRAFMPDYHPMGDLAPRDVVSRAIVDQMRPDRRHARLPGPRAHRLKPTSASASPASPRRASHFGHRHCPRQDSRPPGRPLHGRRRQGRPGRADQPRRTCTPAARSPPRACTGPTAWAPTACWRAWSSARAAGRQILGDLRRAGRERGPRVARARCAVDVVRHAAAELNLANVREQPAVAHVAQRRHRPQRPRTWPRPTPSSSSGRATSSTRSSTSRPAGNSRTC